MIATSQRRLSSQKLAQVIALIEREGKNVGDITHTSAVPGYWFGKYPLPPLPLWDSVVLDSIHQFKNGFLPVAFAEQADVRFFQRVIDTVGPHGNFHFDIPFKHPESKLESLSLELWIENGAVFVGFGCVTSIIEEKLPAEVRDLEEMIRRLDLPYAVEKKDKLYFLKHTSKDGVIFRPDEGRNYPPWTLVGTLPGLSLREVVSKFRKMLKTPGLKAREGKWGFTSPRSYPQPKDPLRFYEDFNGLGLPPKNVECTFMWHLKDYSLFQEIARMAEFTENNSTGQDLLRFEWKGYQGKLNAVCGVDEQFKLRFEFKDTKGGYPFLQHLKETLKTGCTIY